MFSLFSTSHSKIGKSNESGFGLIELMVSISIMVIVISIVLVRQTSFNSAVLLRSQAYEVALQLREIQLAAVSANYDSAGFRSVIGAHFNASNGSNASYSIFRDGDSDYYYDAGDEEFGLQGQIDSRFEIRAIRTVGDGPPASSGLSVVFERPNFDARFFDSNGEIFATSAEIDVARVGAAGSGVGDVRTVEITSAGQISVQ